MNRSIRTFIFICLCILSLHAKTQQTPQKFVQETQYLLYLPENYQADTTAKWPMVIFLHGSGESGTDLNKVKVHGPPKLVEQGKSFPFILISPQAANGWQPQVLVAMIRDIKSKLRVDPERVYLTGLSMGGFGTWELAMKYPEEFAAIAPICGGGDTAKIYRLEHMSVWNFHGAKDDAVPLSASEKMMNALKRYNKDAKFTIYPDAGHDSWTETYNNDSFFTWLLAQRRFRYTEKPQAAAKLQQYTGEFLSNEKDTLVFFVKGDSLMVNTHKGRDHVMRMKCYQGDVFFFDEGAPAQIRFERNAQGAVNRFVYEGEDRVVFPKLKQTAKNSKGSSKK